MTYNDFKDSSEFIVAYTDGSAILDQIAGAGV